MSDRVKITAHRATQVDIIRMEEPRMLTIEHIDKMIHALPFGVAEEAREDIGNAIAMARALAVVNERAWGVRPLVNSFADRWLCDDDNDDQHEGATLLAAIESALAAMKEDADV